MMAIGICFMHIPGSTDPENDDVETDQQKQGTVDVASDITEAKDLYD